MTAIIPAETRALLDRGDAIAELTVRAASVFELDATAPLPSSVQRVQELLDRVADDLDLARDLVVDSPELMAEAQQILGRLATVFSDSGEMERERKALVALPNAWVKLVNAGYNAPCEAGKQVMDSLKRRVLAFDAEQRRLAAERAEAERRERERKAAEAAEAERLAAAQAQALIEQAKAAQEQGGEVAAQALLAQAGEAKDAARARAAAAQQALHVVAAAPTLAKGVRGTWKAEVVSIDSLILAAADRIRAGDRSLVGLLAVDESAANAKAKAEKEGMNVPGLRSVFVPSLSVRKEPVA